MISSMPTFKYSIPAQEQIFSGLWDKFSQQVMTGEGSVDFPDAAELYPRYTTTVIRLPKTLSEKLAHELQGACAEDYHYPTEDVHLTLLNLDSLLLGRQDIDWVALREHIAQAIKGLPALEFEIRDIGIFPTTVYAQAYDMHGGLELYRNAIVKAVASYLQVEASAAALVPGVAFINLVRFKNKPEPSLVEFIRNKRETEVGTFKPTEFEVVTTDKLLSKPHTIQRAVIGL
jgi:2'-5' RNA ligase